MTDEQLEQLIIELRRIRAYATTTEQFKFGLMAIINWLEFGCNED